MAIGRMSAPARLLVVVGQLAGGGLERQLVQLLANLDRSAWRPAVAVWDFDPAAHYVAPLARLGVPVHGLPRVGGAAARTARLVRLARRLKPRLVQSFTFFTNFPAWLAATAVGAPALGALRNDYVAERVGAGTVGGLLSSRFPPIIASNSRAARSVARDRGLPGSPSRLTWVPNCVDLSRFRPRPLPPGERFEIIGIGRLAPQKDWGTCLRALARLDLARPWRFRLFGDGQLREAVRGEAERLGLGDRVEMSPFDTDIATRLAESHVLVLSSLHEGMPNVVVEAMACGRAVVATDVGDVAAIVRDGREGFVVAPRDEAAMAARLRQLAADPALSAELGAHAARRAAIFGDGRILAARYERLYRRLLGPTPCPG